MQTGKAGKCGVGAETGKEREAHMKEAERLAGYIMHKHYCEHDVEAGTGPFFTEFLTQRRNTSRAETPVWSSF